MIKKLTITIVLSAFFIAGNAQENQNNQSEYTSIFSKDDGTRVAHGGYGSIGFGYSNIDDKDALLVSLKGAWVIDHKIALGFAATGFMNNLDKTTKITDYYLAGGYGGFFFEPIFFSKSPVHFSVPILIGGGGVSTVPQNYWDGSGNWGPQDYDVFFVFEPGIEMELNIVRFFRLSLGTSYRFTNGVILNYPLNDPIPTKVLDTYNFYINLKFGKF